MSKPVSIPNAFAAQVGPIPLSQLDANFTAVANAINDTATYSNYFVDSSGAANTITVTVSAPLVFAYTAGISLQVKLSNTNTSTTVNINVNALGNKAVILNDGSVPPIGSLRANSVLDLSYDGTSFRVINQSGTNTFTTGLFGNGSAGAPSVAASADTDTGMYWPSANTLGWSTGAALGLRLDGGGVLAAALNTGLPTSAETAVYLGQRSGLPALYLSAFGQAAGSRLFEIIAGASFSINFQNDANTTGNAAFSISRTSGTQTPSQIRGWGPVAAGLVDMTPDGGTFTATFIDLVGSPTGTASWARMGRLVILNVPAVTANSVGTSQRFTGLPAAIQPSSIASQWIAVPNFVFETASVNDFAVNFSSGSGTVTAEKNGSSSGFTGGVSGYWNNVFSVAYLL